MKSVFIVLLIIIGSGTFAQELTIANNAAGAYRNVNGLEFRFVKDVPGNTPGPDDVIECNVVWRSGKGDGSGKDSLVIDSRTINGGGPMVLPVYTAKYRGDIISGLMLMSAGDHAEFRVACDSLKAAFPDKAMPDFMRSGDYFTYDVDVVAIKSKQQAGKEAQDNEAQQKKTDDKILTNYFTKHKIRATKTNSGLYYTIDKNMVGYKITPGQSVTVRYTGKLLNGKVFDSNVGKETPLTTKVGADELIPAFYEGLLLLKKGMKATLYIPSGLAYGKQSPSGIVPANAVLVFEVEVTDVRDAY